MRGKTVGRERQARSAGSGPAVGEPRGLAAAVEDIRATVRGARFPAYEPITLPNTIPRIVCLCGSGRFQREFAQAFLQLELAGCIVLSIGADAVAAGVTPEQKAELDELHLRKIDLADVVLVLNVGGYIGDSTHAEVAYARKTGKAIVWLDPLPDEAA